MIMLGEIKLDLENTAFVYPHVRKLEMVVEMGDHRSWRGNIGDIEGKYEKREGRVIIKTNPVNIPKIHWAYIEITYEMSYLVK